MHTKIANATDAQAIAAHKSLGELRLRYTPITPTPKQEAFLRVDRLEAFYGGAAGPGKAGRAPRRDTSEYDPMVETQVLTPFGFKLIGDVEPGDQVCNPDGTICRVLAVHDRGEQSFYRVTLRDGSTVEASSDHLWAISLAGVRKRVRVPLPPVPRGLRPEDEWNTRYAQRFRIVTTRELYRLHQTGRRPALPLCRDAALTGSPGRWPLMPAYTLGVLLGDGLLTSGCVQWSKPDDQIEHLVAHDLASHESTATMTVKQRQRSDVRMINGNGTSPQDLLRRVDVWGKGSHERFIPGQYKLRPPAERLAVLQGLFDTDGTVDPRGHVSYTSTSERLALDVQWLLRSLGYRATLTTKPAGYTKGGVYVPCRDAHTIYVQGVNLARLFRLDRKRDRCHAGFNGGDESDAWPNHPILSIEPSGNDHARCITVDHPNGLYVTDDFIVTHNSTGLLAAALQYADVPGYAALILRRTYSDLALPGALMDRAGEWLRPNPDAEWDAQKRTWRFTGGGTLTFGHLDNENDKWRYQGAEFSFVAFDEATQFTESQVRFLFSRLRRLSVAKGAASDGFTIDRVPVRLRLASNPGGPGHAWCEARYVNPETRERDAVFVPARLHENPYLDQESYLESLSHLTTVEQRRLIEGDWTVPDEGTVFRSEWIELVDPATISPRGTRSCRRWDLAATPVSQAAPDPDHAVGLLLERWPDGSFLIRDIVRTRTTPAGLENLARQTAELDGPTVTVVVEQEPGASGKALVDQWARGVLSGFEVRGQRPVGSKTERAMPLAAAAERGLVRSVRAVWTRELLDELASFPFGSHDDQVDALSGAHQYLSRPTPGIRVSVAEGRIETSQIGRGR